MEVVITSFLPRSRAVAALPPLQEANKTPFSSWKTTTSPLLVRKLSPLFFSSPFFSHPFFFPDQDKKLDVLAGVVSNIKDVSLSLGHELKVQDRIIDDLDDHMGKTSTKVSKSTKMASFLTKNASVCGLQLTVLALLVIIVLVALI